MEFAPPTRRAKPITRAQLRKMQESFVESKQYTTEHQQLEAEERTHFEAEFDDELNTL
jgi:hypothetical protein